MALTIGDSEAMKIGLPIMSQFAWVFDLRNQRVGIAPSGACSEPVLPNNSQCANATVPTPTPFYDATTIYIHDLSEVWPLFVIVCWAVGVLGFAGLGASTLYKADMAQFVAEVYWVFCHGKAKTRKRHATTRWSNSSGRTHPNRDEIAMGTQHLLS